MRGKIFGERQCTGTCRLSLGQVGMNFHATLHGCKKEVQPAKTEPMHARFEREIPHNAGRIDPYTKGEHTSSKRYRNIKAFLGPIKRPLKTRIRYMLICFVSQISIVDLYHMTVYFNKQFNAGTRHKRIVLSVVPAGGRRKRK